MAACVHLSETLNYSNWEGTWNVASPSYRRVPGCSFRSARTTVCRALRTFRQNANRKTACRTARTSQRPRYRQRLPSQGQGLRVWHWTTPWGPASPPSTSKDGPPQVAEKEGYHLRKEEKMHRLHIPTDEQKSEGATRAHIVKKYGVMGRMTCAFRPLNRVAV